VAGRAGTGRSGRGHYTKVISARPAQHGSEVAAVLSGI
jgi:hypothetical protein